MSDARRVHLRSNKPHQLDSLSRGCGKRGLRVEAQPVVMRRMMVHGRRKTSKYEVNASDSAKFSRDHCVHLSPCLRRRFWRFIRHTSRVAMTHGRWYDQHTLYQTTVRSRPRRKIDDPEQIVLLGSTIKHPWRLRRGQETPGSGHVMEVRGRYDPKNLGMCTNCRELKLHSPRGLTPGPAPDLKMCRTDQISGAPSPHRLPNQGSEVTCAWGNLIDLL